MSRWQYRVATLKVGMMNYKWKDDDLNGLSIEEALNKLGGGGWELVSNAPYVISGTTGETLFVFKKPA